MSLPPAPPSATFSVPLAEAGIRLSMTWPQVYAALMRGDLRGKKIGASWMIEEESLRVLEESRLRELTS